MVRSLYTTVALIWNLMKTFPQVSNFVWDRGQVKINIPSNTTHFMVCSINSLIILEFPDKPSLGILISCGIGMHDPSQVN